MARILLLTPQLPYPPHQGTSLRNWHILRGLARNHEVALLSFAESEPAFVAEPLAALCSHVETVPAPRRTTAQRLAQLASSSLPDMAERLASDAFTVALRRQLQTNRFDIVQVEGLEMARFMPSVRQFSDAALVLDAHNAETELQRRAYATDTRQPRRWSAALYSRTQISRLEAYERWAMETADATVVVSEQDAANLRGLVADSNQQFTVVPNSIDIGEYGGEQPLPEPAQQFDLLFSGKMDYRPNVDAAVWFADSVWPRLRQAEPGLTWGIVGQRPHGQLDRLREVPGITITGRVDQMQPYLTAAKVVVMPLRIGSGTRLKLIEAMASAKAVVSTSLGAEGFPVEDGRHLLIADSPDDMAAAILRLLRDEVLRRQLGQSARDFAQAYDWRKVAPLLDELYRQLLS